MLPDRTRFTDLPLTGTIWIVASGLGIALLVLAATLLFMQRQRRLPQEELSAQSGGAFLLGLASLNREPAGHLAQRASAGTQRVYSSVLTDWAHTQYGITLSPDGANRLALQHDPIIAVDGRFMRVSLELRDDGALMLVNPFGEELVQRVR